MIVPLALPGVAAGSIFTFSLTLGDYIAPDLVGGNVHQFIGNLIFVNAGRRREPAAGRARSR